MKTMRWSLAVLISTSAAVAATGCEKKTAPADPEPGDRTENAERRDLQPASGDRHDVQPGNTPNRDVPPGSVERRDVETGTTQRVAGMANHSAIESITAARCEREQRCNNIGNGKKYESRNVCVTSVRTDWQSDLSALECPNGIDQNKLDVCLERLRTDGCANPVETLGRVAACRQAELCRAAG